MPDSAGKLAYDEARAAIGAQAATLDGLRARAGTLLAAASLVTSFLGGQVLAKPSLDKGLIVRPDLSSGDFVAIAMFVGVAALTLAILWPYEWRFEMSAKVILGYGKDADVDAVQRQLAAFHENNHDKNEKKLDWLFWCFRGACILLVAETIAWIVELGS